MTRVFPYIDEKLRALFPEIEAAYQQGQAAVLRDALSGLYVALTRARHALHIVLEADGEKGEGTAQTPARILRAALEPGGSAVAGDDAFHLTGDPRWFDDVRVRRSSPGSRSGPGPADRAGAEGRDAPRLRPAGPHRSRLLPRRSASSLEGGQRVELERLLRFDAGGSLERGSIVHGWCEAIEWIDDGTPGDEALRSIARRLAPGFPDAEIDGLIGRFRTWTYRPAIVSVLGRAAYPAGARVEREHPFAMRAGDVILQGIIDRLVLWPAGAEILDFKTDAIDPGDEVAIATRIAFYRPQLEAYRSAVAGIWKLPAERVAAKLVFLAPGEVHEI